VIVDPAAAVRVNVAPKFHDLTAVFHGGCFGQPARLCVAEFLDHAFDTCLTLVAVVTNDTHSRTLMRREPVGLSRFEQPHEHSAKRTLLRLLLVGVQARCT
jgi:hypothetical protein